MRDDKSRLDHDWWDAPPTAGALLILLMIVVLFVGGCAAPIEGKVVGKDVDPGRTEMYWTSEQRACGTERYTTSTTTNGKTTTTTKSRTKYCSNRVQRSRNVPARWQLNIQKDDGTQQWITVGRSTYERIRVGERMNSESPRPHDGPAR